MMLFILLRGYPVVTVHVRSHDGRLEVSKEGVDGVWFQRPCMTSDWRSASSEWREDPPYSILMRRQPHRPMDLTPELS